MCGCFGKSCLNFEYKVKNITHTFLHFPTFSTTQNTSFNHLSSTPFQHLFLSPLFLPSHPSLSPPPPPPPFLFLLPLSSPPLLSSLSRTCWRRATPPTPAISSSKISTMTSRTTPATRPSSVAATTTSSSCGSCGALVVTPPWRCTWNDSLCSPGGKKGGRGGWERGDERMGGVEWCGR